MNIVTPQVCAYLDTLYRPASEFLAALRKSAEEEHVPVILRDTEGLLLSLLQLNPPARILEIGTAVGYSSIFFATACPDASITTLEVSEEMADTARTNIQLAGMSDQIQVIAGDARETLLDLQKQGQSYDMIFIDAAKGQYRIFWDHSKPLWSQRAVTICDNVLFKGMTASDDFVLDRKNKTIIRRMRDYLAYITGLEDVDTSVLAVGDGVSISIVKQKE